MKKKPSKKLSYTERERERVARFRKESSRSSRNVKIGKNNLRRRKKALSDVYEFLGLYFSHRFYNPLTPMHRDLVEAVLFRATHGGDQAIAAPRGEGKTTISECIIIYCILKGLLKFPLIVGATKADASRILDNIKNEFETNDLLAADFHEVCDPIRALEGSTAKQNMQLVDDERTHLKWSADFVEFPHVPKKYKSPCAGTILMTRGLDAAIRGINRHSKRPDFVLIDDPETRESAASELQIRTREETIDRDIAGLGGQSRKIARVALCTVQSVKCLSYKLTDPSVKPSWAGRRYRLLAIWPKNRDLWDEYMMIRQASMKDGDQSAKAATEFYLKHREQMDEGAFVCNPACYVAENEYSALQHCFNIIADRGMDAFLTEYQNEPPIDARISETAVTRDLIERRLSGFSRRELPPNCKVTIGVDVGKIACHWVAGAVRECGTYNIIDYGIIEVSGAEKTDKQEVIERAILRALLGWKDELASNPFRDADGNPVALSAVLIDSGYSPAAVQEFVRVSGAPFRASKGVGGGTFQHGQQSSTRRVGNHWYASMQPSRQWLYMISADQWKRAVHERFVADPTDADGRANPGSLSLFIPAGRRDHHTFSAHIVAEEWSIEFTPGKGEKAHWVVHSANNHFLDATALCLCGGEVEGRGIFGKMRGPPQKKMTLAEMAEAAKRTHN